VDTIKGTTSEYLNNSGYIMLALVISWLVFGAAKLIDDCSGRDKPSKCSGYVWYYLLTLQLIVLMQVSYYSIYALFNYSLNNTLDSVNITTSLFMLFSVLFFLASLWYLTFKNKF
jgi:hypothetical protein